MSDGFAHRDPRGNVTATWQVQRTGLPLLRRRCSDCATNVSTATGKFRVNANGRLLDVWLLIRCAYCGHNARIKVHHRTNVARFPPETLSGYMTNDLDLVATALLDPLMRVTATTPWTGPTPGSSLHPTPNATSTGG